MHLRELQREMNLPISTLYYHINFLKRYRIIVAEKDGAKERFYVEQLNKDERKFLGILRKRKCREIISSILVNETADTKSLGEKLNLPTSTLSFYLNYLVEQSILKREKVGYENIYSVSDKNKVTKILISYKSSLLDRLVDKSLSTWLETRYGK